MLVLAYILAESVGFVQRIADIIKANSMLTDDEIVKNYL